uniref:Uncharacterized protein n=1 Tax=Romanomermis culicivorax TaxID=13658 RepID=A0A915IL78_ROMCU
MTVSDDESISKKSQDIGILCRSLARHQRRMDHSDRKKVSEFGQKMLEEEYSAHMREDSYLWKQKKQTDKASVVFSAFKSNKIVNFGAVHLQKFSEFHFRLKEKILFQKFGLSAVEFRQLIFVRFLSFFRARIFGQRRRLNDVSVDESAQRLWIHADNLLTNHTAQSFRVDAGCVAREGVRIAAMPVSNYGAQLTHQNTIDRRRFRDVISDLNVEVAFRFEKLKTADDSKKIKKTKCIYRHRIKPNESISDAFIAILTEFDSRMCRQISDVNS